MTPGDTFEDTACQDVVELITDYLGATLSAEQTAAIEAHLDECDGCKAYLDQVRATIGLLASMPSEALSDQTFATLMRAFKEQR